MTIYKFSDSHVEYSKKEADFYKNITGYDYKIIIV